MSINTREQVEGGIFLGVETQGNHLIAIFRGVRGLYQMRKSTLMKRIEVLKAHGMDASEGEKALRCLEEVDEENE